MKSSPNNLRIENKNEIHNKVFFGEVSNSTLDVYGVLWFRGRVYAPQFGELVQNMLAKAHYLQSSIHLSETKIYRYLR